MPSDPMYDVKLNGRSLWNQCHLVKTRYIDMTTSCLICEGVGCLYSKGSAEIKCPQCKGKKTFIKRMSEYYTEEDTVTSMHLYVDDGLLFQLENDRNSYGPDWIFKDREEAEKKVKMMNIREKDVFENKAKEILDARA